MAWTVQWKRKLDKHLGELPEQIQLAFRALIHEIEVSGPVRGNWKNYSKLSKTQHHATSSLVVQPMSSAGK